jgi:putative aldouronate transport system permease protein
MNISIPGISNIIIMQLIFTVIGIFDVGFEQAYILINPAAYEKGLVISTYVYTMGIRQFQYSMSTAVGLAQSIVGLFLLFGANKLARKYSPDGAIW